MTVPRKDGIGCCDKKEVLVSVYVERPRPRSAPGRRRHIHHRRYDYLRLGDERPSYYRGGQGYDRKAELLLYSRRLREAARSRSVAPAPAPRDQYRNSVPKNPERIAKIVSAKGKQPGTCFGDWKRLLVPSFVRSYLVGYKQRSSKRRRRKKKKEIRKTGSNSDEMSAAVVSSNKKEVGIRVEARLQASEAEVIIRFLNSEKPG
ncbi:hypothetical protein H6P81_005430 [Aristolochia fimbriata]|uniref:Uncharacterized protein n=1 Tax=Aristolochia fimbriata TaxID=158543 RepID=A0AAV7EVJ1_ARIFI|nr:hypothetical protein H6P81_005430 [Aristolochia fimbriata]